MSDIPDSNEAHARRDLPPRGTAERDSIEQEALAIALDFLHMSEGRVREALYALREHYRVRFLRDGWTHPHRDATRLERIVEHEWALSLMRNMPTM